LFPKRNLKICPTAASYFPDFFPDCPPAKSRAPKILREGLLMLDPIFHSTPYRLMR